MRSTYNQGVMNKWLVRDLHQLKQFCGENGLETFRAKNVEICWKAIYLQTNCLENCQDQDFWKVIKFIYNKTYLKRNLKGFFAKASFPFYQGTLHTV